jgi:hypothetical protein
MIKSSTKMAGSHDVLGNSIVVFNYLDVKQKKTRYPPVIKRGNGKSPINEGFTVMEISP